MADQKHVDPTALGHFGLAMVTLVASSQKLGITAGTASVIPWAIFLGACAQIVAAIYDFKKGSQFGGIAFFAYGFFWLAVALSWSMTGGLLGETAAASFDTHGLAFAFLGYLIFSIFLTIGSTQTYTALFIIFVLIDLLFVGLTFSTFGIMKEPMHELAAISELLIAIVAFYSAGAQVVNAQFGRVVFPIGSKVTFGKSHPTATASH